MSGRIAKLFKDPESSDCDINLLLLGGTGVGKSTFINSISNYFKYRDFKSAQKGTVQVLIPVSLNLSNSKVVCGDPDKNESHDHGKSATQNVKVYLFPIKVDDKVYNLRIVDSPGVGDPRGIDQDNIHIDNILAYLSTLKKLHGICFVMKANETRFTSFVEYCLKQVLTRLDKSASNNIIFITTYSKSAQYTAGETKIHCLGPLVDNIKSKPPHVDIPLTDKNVFALDNEAFKVLLEMQEGKKFRKHEVAGFSESWKASSKACRRLLKYIIGDEKTAPLQPHEVESTISVNEVRFLVEQLATPIAEVSENIQDNLLLLDRHKKNLNLETQSLGQLKQQLFIPCVDLIVRELDQPVTVCTDPRCAEVVKVNKVTEWHYAQKCHNPCFLEGVPREMVGDPGLLQCQAIQDNENCIECDCNWRVHMHIYKTTEKVQTQKEDTTIREAIRDKEDARFKIQKLMKDLNKRMSELEEEGEIIAESVAKFSFFLQEHALTPFNDAYSDYIKQLIKNEKSLGKFSDPMVIQKLEKLVQKHEHLQRTLQKNAQKFGKMGAPPNLTPQAIKKSISNLYKLKHMGPKIEELIRKSSACRSRETQKNFNCVVSQQVDLDDLYSIYGGGNSVYGSEYSYGTSRSDYYSQYELDGLGGSQRKTRSPSRHEYSRYEAERQSTRSRRSSDSDNSGTLTYVSGSRSVKSSKSTRSSGRSSDDGASRYTSSSRSVRSSRNRRSSSDDETSVKYESSSRSTRSTKSRNSDSDHYAGSRSVRSSKSRRSSDEDTSITYGSSTRSVKSTKSRHLDSDDDTSVKYDTSARSVKSSKSRYTVSDDDTSVKYESSARSVKSTKSRHLDSDDDTSVKYARSVKSTKSRHLDSDDDKSVRSSRSKRTHNSDDDKSVRSSRSDYHSEYRSQKSSRTKHTPESDDNKSVRSHRSTYSTSSKSSRAQFPLPDSDDNKSGRHKISGNNFTHDSGDKSSKKHSKKSDDERSVRSSRSEYYLKGGNQHPEKSSNKNPEYESKGGRRYHRKDGHGEKSDEYESKKSSMSQYYSRQDKKNKSKNVSGSSDDDSPYDFMENEE